MWYPLKIANIVFNPLKNEPPPPLDVFDTFQMHAYNNLELVEFFISITKVLVVINPASWGPEMFCFLPIYLWVGWVG